MRRRSMLCLRWLTEEEEAKDGLMGMGRRITRWEIVMLLVVVEAGLVVKIPGSYEAKQNMVVVVGGVFVRYCFGDGVVVGRGGAAVALWA